VAPTPDRSSCQLGPGSEPLFDLARIEATRPDGGTETLNGVRALVSSYSSDGGHLNAAGADVVARALVTYLATL
jgi:lysophospholipase L1-like esterase